MERSRRSPAAWQAPRVPPPPRPPSAFAGPARHYAGDWVIAPDASLDAEEMDVLLFTGTDRWKFLSLFREIQLGNSGHLSRGLASIVRGRVVIVKSLEDYPV